MQGKISASSSSRHECLFDRVFYMCSSINHADPLLCSPDDKPETGAPAPERRAAGLFEPFQKGSIADRGGLLMEHNASRRDLLLTSLLATLPLSLSGAVASPINPAQTIVKLPDALAWKSNPANPVRSVDMCPLTGDINAPGLYYTLVRWWPGYMSAPHTYTTDRFCVVVSGTWWCNSGGDFDPASCVPAPAGSFVRRVAGTPHYDGVIRGRDEPAIIAICGVGPVNYALIDPSQPGVRPV